MTPKANNRTEQKGLAKKCVETDHLSNLRQLGRASKAWGFDKELSGDRVSIVIFLKRILLSSTLLLCSCLATHHEEKRIKTDVDKAEQMQARGTAKRDSLFQSIQSQGAKVRLIKRLIDMSEENWVAGEENIRHGEILCLAREKWPDEFSLALERARAKKSAQILMEAVETGGVFREEPDVILLNGDPQDIPKSMSIDLL